MKQIASLPNSIMFDEEYALYHNKEEYLSMGKTVKKIITTADDISDDGNVYL